MGLWTKIKNIFKIETTGGSLPRVTQSFEMPPVKPPRKPTKDIEVTIVVDKKKSNRKLSSEMPKAINPRIKRKLTVDGGSRVSAATLLTAAAVDLETIVKQPEAQSSPDNENDYND